MATMKPSFSPEYTEFETRDDARRIVRSTRLVESVRMGLTVLTFIMGLTIVGTSGDALSVYRQTNITNLLPVWPTEFNLGPTIALVTGGVVVTAASAVSITASKIAALRNKNLIHNYISHLSPITNLFATLVAMSFFYAINTSDKVDSLQSWTCRWSAIQMTNPPHYSTLCKQSKAALYLSIALIPIEVVVLCLAAWGYIAEKKAVVMHERKGSPARGSSGRGSSAS